MPVPALASRFLDRFTPDSTLVQTELKQQARRIRQPGSVRRALGALLRWSGLMLGLILAGGVLMGSLLQRDAYPIGVQLEWLPNAFLVSVVLAHFVVQFRTIVLASSSIARERERNSWELLILTGIAARDIVRSKWRAVVMSQLPTYLWLGALRACAVVWYGYEISNESRWWISYYNTQVEVIPPHPPLILFAFASVMLLTLLNLPLTAACALVGGSLGKGTATALSRGIAIRMLVGLVPGITVLLAGILIFNILRFNDFASSIWSWMALLPLTLADNGVIVPGQLVRVTFMFPGSLNSFGADFNTIVPFVLALLVFIPIYIWMIGGVLRWAERRVITQGALR